MRKLLRFLLWTAVVLGVIIGAARLTAVRWWRVPDNDPYLEASITPTLRGGDLILLWRLTEPDFGDLVLCPEPDAPERIVIGRIVGEGEDKVTVDGSRFTVNDQRSRTERACLPPTFETEHPGTGEPIEQTCSFEDARGSGHMRGNVPPQGVVKPTTDAKEVPPGHVYLLSDNRAFPYDSRDYGTVERSTCTETVVFRLVGKKGYLDSASRFTFIQ